VARPLPEVLLLVVCGAICDCDDYDLIADWGRAHLSFSRRYLPYIHGVPGGRWLTIPMSRIDPTLFSAAFTAWVRETWPDRPEFVATDGKTSRRSHDRRTGAPPLHLASASAMTSRLGLGQEAVADEPSETTVIPLPLEPLAEGGGPRAASSASMRSPPTPPSAVPSGRPTPTISSSSKPISRACAPRSRPVSPRRQLTPSTPGSTSTRPTAASRSAPPRVKSTGSPLRRFPSELRLPAAVPTVSVTSHTELENRRRLDMRLLHLLHADVPRHAAAGVCGHWGIETSLHWTSMSSSTMSSPGCESVTAP
jgi:hypothetical protein